MRAQAVLLLATVAAIVLGSQDQTIQNGFFQGRSADMILQKKSLHQDNSGIFVPFNDFIDSWPASASLEEKSLADLISAAVGGPVINEDTHRQNFPNLNMFNKATTNVLFLVDGLSAEESKGLSVVKKDGTFVPLTKTSYPQDVVATCASMATGYTPSEHGIVNSEWISNNLIVKAYFKGAHPLLASFSDIISQLYKSSSVFSTSMDVQLSAAFGAHPYLDSNTINNYAYAWDPETETYSDIYNEDKEKLSYSKFISMISVRKYVEESSVDLGHLTLTVGKVKFSLNVPEQFLFFAEMESIYHSVNEHIANHRKDINLYNIVFSSFKDLKKVCNAEQMDMAMKILDEFMSSMSSLLKKTYGNKMMMEYVFLGENKIDMMRKDTETEMMAFNEVNHIVDSYSTFHRLYPQIHIYNSHRLTADHCKQLQKRIFKEYTVVCPRVQGDYMNKRSLFRRQNNGTEPVLPSQNEQANDATYFHILIWFNIILFFVAFFAIYTLFNMDTGADSLLYRMTSTNRR